MNPVEPYVFEALGHCSVRCAACTRLVDAGQMTEREQRSYGVVMLQYGFNALFEALEQL